MHIETAVPLATLVSITVAALVLVQDWSEIHVRSAGRLVLSTLLGIPLGLLLLTKVAEPIAKASGRHSSFERPCRGTFFPPAFSSCALLVGRTVDRCSDSLLLALGASNRCCGFRRTGPESARTSTAISVLDLCGPDAGRSDSARAGIASLNAEGYVFAAVTYAAADSCSPECFGGASTIRAKPITAKMATPHSSPRSLGVWNAIIVITSA
jgi:hypothetical protein